MLPCCVIVCRSFSVAPINQQSRATLFSLFSRGHKNASLSFQSLAHSFQFTYCDISSIFLALRTLCQKPPGVRVASTSKNPCAPLTPTKSMSFLSFTRNSNGIYLFQNAHLSTSLESYSFTKQGVGVGVANSSKSLPHLPTLGLANFAGSLSTAPSPDRTGRWLSSPPRLVSLPSYFSASLLRFSRGFCASPGFLLSSPSQGENFRCL